VASEPRQHRWFIVSLAGLTLAAVPFWFVGRETVFVFGVPVWLWTSLGFTTALAALTAWGMLRLWDDEDDDD